MNCRAHASSINGVSVMNPTSVDMCELATFVSDTYKCNDVVARTYLYFVISLAHKGLPRCACM